MYGVSHEQVAHSLQYQDRVRRNPRLSATLHTYLAGYRADGYFTRDADGLYFTANDASVSYARECVLSLKDSNPFAAPPEGPKTPLTAYIRDYVTSTESISKLFAYPYQKRPGKVYGDPIDLTQVYAIVAHDVWTRQGMTQRLQEMLGYAARIIAEQCLDPVYLEAYYAEALQYQVLSACTDADISRILDLLRP